MSQKDTAIPIASAFINKWEGKPTYNSAGNYVAFDDKYGNWTIGYGVTSYPNGQAVKPGDVITVEQGVQYKQWHINEKSKGIYNLIDEENYTANQLAAIISFTYTTGVTGFQESNLYKALQAGKTGDNLRSVWIASKVTSNGIKSNGLVNRRIDEYMLYSGQYNELYSFYLRNEGSIKKAAIITGLVAVSAAVYVYFPTKNKKN